MFVSDEYQHSSSKNMDTSCGLKKQNDSVPKSSINNLIKFNWFIDSIPKLNLICGIFRKITVRALRAQKRNVETCPLGRILLLYAIQ
jgi:hypothetical protein